jgi:hypothetical protein
MKWKPPKYIDTWANVGAAEHEVRCEFEIQPEEKDTNTPAGFEIVRAWFEDEGCILSDMKEVEIDDLTERVEELLNSMAQAYAEDERY